MCRQCSPGDIHAIMLILRVGVNQAHIVEPHRGTQQYDTTVISMQQKPA